MHSQPRHCLGVFCQDRTLTPLPLGIELPIPVAQDVVWTPEQCLFPVSNPNHPARSIVTILSYLLITDYPGLDWSI
jgi:hypothetical protein